LKKLEVFMTNFKLKTFIICTNVNNGTAFRSN